MIVVVPTVAADSKLMECVRSLERQSLRDFEVIVIHNSGRSLVLESGLRASVIEMGYNAGFGAAINRACAHRNSPFVATLNDDAVAQPEWLVALLQAIEPRPDVGMCASQVRLSGQDRLDSAGMLIARDGSSKQRGHGAPPATFSSQEEVLFPSASAALYRRAMLEQIGFFDEDFFLYCEDTDLGLRARWAGWKCLYVPGAIADHHYSHSAGRASPLKAYYVERNRLFVLFKNFPGRMLAAAPVTTVARYWWHLWLMFRGRGSAARFRQEGNSALQLLAFVLRAHIALLRHGRDLLRKRRAVRRTANISPRAFEHLLCAHLVGAREVAEL